MSCKPNKEWVDACKSCVIACNEYIKADGAFRDNRLTVEQLLTLAHACIDACRTCSTESKRHGSVCTDESCAWGCEDAVAACDRCIVACEQLFKSCSLEMTRESCLAASAECVRLCRSCAVACKDSITE